MTTRTQRTHVERVRRYRRNAVESLALAVLATAVVALWPAHDPAEPIADQRSTPPVVHQLTTKPAAVDQCAMTSPDPDVYAQCVTDASAVEGDLPRSDQWGHLVVTRGIVDLPDSWPCESLPGWTCQWETDTPAAQASPAALPAQFVQVPR